MRTTIKIGKHEYTATTEHSASCYGLPVVLRDGEITDLHAEHIADEYDPVSVMIDYVLSGEYPYAAAWTATVALARLANIHIGGQATLSALRALVDDMPDATAPQAIVDEFFRRGKILRAAEEA
jgi:hypothetical protein